MPLVCNIFLVTNLRVHRTVLPFYQRIYCLVLNQTETFLNERQSIVDRQWRPAITTCMLVSFEAGISNI
jgi:hypothetical protein